MPNLSSPTARSEANRLLDEKSFRRLLHRSTFVLALSLGLPLLALFGMVLLLLHSARRVDHTDRVIAEAHRLDKRLLRMQSSFRGYRLANDENYLTTFWKERNDFDSALRKLAALVSDNSLQTGQVSSLQRESAAWFLSADEELKRVRGNPDLVRDPSFMLRSVPLFDATQNRLEKIIGEEMRLLTARDKNLSTVVTFLMFALGIAAAVGIPALIFWLNRLLHRTNASYHEILAAAERRANELQVTLSSIGDAVVATDIEGKVEFLNPAAEGLTGWTNREAQGLPLEKVFVIFSEDTGAIIENPVKRVLEENIVVGLANHTILRSRQGAEIAIEDSAAPIRGENGSIRGVILVFHDVREKREAEMRILESQRRAFFLDELGTAIRTLLDAESIMEVATRLLGQHLQASRCAYAEVDSESDHFIIPHDYTNNCPSTVGSYHLSLFGPRAVDDMHGGRTLVLRDIDQELAAEEGAAMFKAIGVKAIICCPSTKEGKLRAMMAVHQTEPRDWKAEEILLVEEVVERCWATIERARAEAESKGEAERFRLLSEVAFLQVWTADTTGDLDYANQECVNYFGLASPDEILGKVWVNFVHPEDRAQAGQHWQDSLASGKGYEVEFRLRGKSGEYRWFIARAQAMRDSENRIVKWFGSNTDIQDLKMAQSKAEQANRAKDAFLAALSHELRTPLTPVLMTAAALRSDNRLPGDVAQQLEMMERNIALEARLIDDLLDVTSIAQGKMQLRTQPCNVHTLINQAIEIVRKDVVAKEISLTCECLAKRCELTADPARLQQVIWNLLRNAVKFTPHGGKITIYTRDGSHDGLQIEVEDSGIGIASSALEQIFLPFDQGGLTGDHRFGGMGLGLAIARAILHAQGGTIRAQSAGLGSGASFVIDLPGARLPTTSQELDSQPLAKPVTTQAKNSSLRLLIVEDDESTLAVLGKLLTRDGHHVVPANSVTAALAAAEKGVFDLVISDLGLPDASGLELMEKLRDLYGLQGIALSGYGMEQDLTRSRAAGFVLHLTKPIDFAHLRQAIATL